MKRVLQHRWQSLPGFRRHTCSKCGVLHVWIEAFGRMMYQDQHGHWAYQRPDCILENCTMSKTEKK